MPASVSKCLIDVRERSALACLSVQEREQVLDRELINGLVQAEAVALEQPVEVQGLQHGCEVQKRRHFAEVEGTEQRVDAVVSAQANLGKEGGDRRIETQTACQAGRGARTGQGGRGAGRQDLRQSLSSGAKREAEDGEMHLVIETR